MLADPRYIDIKKFDAYYTFGDILALPEPRDYNEVVGSEFIADGLGPCGRPEPVSVHRAVRIKVRSWVPLECGRPLVPRTGVQYVVLYASGYGRAPEVPCGGTSRLPVNCTRGKSADCTYQLTIDPSCLRVGKTAKVVLRQMWRRKTEVLVEALDVGYLAPTATVVRAIINGAPLVFLSDVEVLLLSEKRTLRLCSSLTSERLKTCPFLNET
ncbi:hypothetical protein V5799_002704 [Amblyomma americanum]|uniref:Uncharacterized protein n=1 Tax=Amblyomma americanum TaxID=6943 RepID=A0AAQ4DB21_AMBAM